MKGSFSLDLSAACKKLDNDMKVIVRRFAFTAFKKVVMKSPVGNPSLWKGKAPPGYVGGRFRANWSVSVGAVDTASTTEATDKDGTTTISAISKGLEGWKGQGSTFLNNNLPYAQRLEYGHSTQTPTGMIRTTVEEMQGWANAPQGD